jgi:hypothetical protein
MAMTARPRPAETLLALPAMAEWTKGAVAETSS